MVYYSTFYKIVKRNLLGIVKRYFKKPNINKYRRIGAPIRESPIELSVVENHRCKGLIGNRAIDPLATRGIGTTSDSGPHVHLWSKFHISSILPPTFRSSNMHDNANLLMRPVQLGLPFIARIFHGPLYNSEGESLSCAVPEQPTAPLAMATNQRATRLFVESFIFDNENAKRFWETLRYAMECRLDMNRILSRLISRREYFKLFSFHFRDYKNRTTSFVLKIGKYYPFSFCVALHIFSKKTWWWYASFRR